ncbi:MAG: flippase-like domain-containing protein [Bacteroidetes bacterium]|nr:MAG: flippase-like domain-containing protein [Bacteroidota bacterium]
MKAKFFKALKIIIPIGIGVYLSWYFISGLSKEELQQTKDAFFEANYFWVIMSLLIALLSHFSRAYRWRFLLEALGYKTKLSHSFHAVMSGYVINFTVPRSGEIARAGLMSSAENIPFEKSFGTIVAERVVDVLMLGVIVLISGYLQTDTEEFKAITARENEGGSSILLYVLSIGGVIGLAALIAFLKIPKFKAFVLEKLLGFWEGLKSIWKMKKKWWFVFHTLVIWICYVGMFWVSGQIFEETSDMPIGCMFGAFVVGAAAIALLPGGMGAYPAWVTAVLALYGINFAAFGIFVWVAQTALLVVFGLISLFLIQRSIKTPK